MNKIFLNRFFALLKMTHKSNNKCHTEAFAEGSFSAFGQCPQNDRCVTAFTLAEVLITLGIIGVVAAMTIPILINKTNELQYKTAYKNAYADLSNALNKAKYDGELVSVTPGVDTVAVRTNFNAIKANFKVIQSCENSLTEGCWVDSCESKLDCSAWARHGQLEGQSYGFIDSSGRFWNHYKAQEPTYFFMILDTNGAKAPNSYGRDRWLFGFNVSSGSFIPTSSGIPIKIDIRSDILTQQEEGCAQGNCYYKSWLIGD